MSGRPAVFLTLFFALGLAASHFFKVPLYCAVLLFAIALVGTFMVFGGKSAGPWALVLLFSAGFFWMALSVAISRLAPLRELENRYVAIEGTVLSCEGEEGKSRMKVRVEKIACQEHHARCQGAIVLVNSGCSGSFPFHCGDYIEVRGVLEPLHANANPCCYDFEEACAVEGIHERIFVKELAGVRKTGMGAISPFVCLAEILRENMKGVYYSNHGRVRTSVLRGILFGEKNELPEKLLKAFRDTGTIHLLVASGMKVSFVLVLVFYLGSAMRLSKRTCSLCALPIIIIYTFMAGAVAAVVRASVMAVLVIAARMLGRAHDLANTLFSAAFIMLLVNPHMLIDAGFQLSVVAVLGLVVTLAPFDRLTSHAPFVLRSSLELFLVSVRVQLLLAPLLAYYFYSFSLLSPLCNFVTVPPSGLLLYGALMEGTLGVIWLPLSVPFAWINELLLSFIIGAVKFFGAFSFCAFPVARPTIAWLFWYYGLLAVLLYYLHKGRYPERHIVAGGCVAVMLILLLHGMVTFWSDRPLKVVFLDVGEGDAIYMAMPTGEHILLDGGPRTMKGEREFDMGERVLLPFLRGSRVPSLDLLCLSHCHDDHAGGLSRVVESMKVSTYLEGSSSSEDRNYILLKSALGAHRIPCRHAWHGATLLFKDGAMLKVLRPHRKAGCNEDPNRLSVVLRLSFGGRHILLMGDCDREGERQLLEENDPLVADLLKVGHHGSAYSSSPAFLDAVHPRYAVISVGLKNPHGHPSPRVLSELKKRSVRVFRTDRDGAVMVTVDRRGMNFHTMRGLE